MSQSDWLANWARERCHPDYLPHTRIHSIPFPMPGKWFLKREDETGMITPGGKLRKFASLIYYFRQKGYQTIFFEAGRNSNNALCMFSLCKEQGIPVKMVTKPGHPAATLSGNAFLLTLLASPNEIIELSDQQSFRDFKLNYIPTSDDGQILWVPEGIFMEEALPGSLTLEDSIIRNEQSHSLRFDQVWIDAGTGMSAIGLVLAQNFSKHPRLVNIVGMADDREVFDQKLWAMHQFLHQELGTSSPNSPIPWHYYRPSVAKSFGATNATIFNKIKSFAREYGLLLDPIYMSKLVLTIEKLPKSSFSEGTHLIIHSGGSQTIFGFNQHFNS